MTLAEIIEEANKNPEFRKQVAIWAKDTVEGKEILTNFANVHFDEKVKDKIGELHTGYDNDIFEILGERKENNQKSYDYVKKLVTELKTLRADKGGDNEVKIKELKAEMKKMQDEGTVNEHWKKIYDEALIKWNETETDLNGKLTAKDAERLGLQVGTDLTTGRSGLTIKEGIPQEAVDAMIKVHEESIKLSAKIIDGKVVYHKEDGTPWMNAEYKPITSREIWTEKLGTLLGENISGGGGGASPTVKGSIVTTGTGDKATKKLVLDKSKFSTKVEFNNHAEKALRAEGISTGDDEYNGLIDGAYKEYKVSELEMN